ncbi:hypothetical protein C8Q70DRAFT_911754 [Cubamyces menziesii]|nr:hypothetical protein C8Q70DRAFT_911754 [Cubamyces menziesii]
MGSSLKEAVFHTACIFKWGSDPEVGNYVPNGATAFCRVPEGRIQTQPNYLCQFSYVMDTSRDRQIWDAQKAFEDYIQRIPGFNKAQKNRRTWQDGSVADGPASSYVFTSQVFMKRAPTTQHREADISYQLHDWIKAATGPKSSYFANPDRPEVFDLCEGELRSIKAATPPYLRGGDLVWISFSVEFVIGLDLWHTSLVPLEIIRVALLSSDLVGGAGTRYLAASELAPRPRLQVGMKVQLSKSTLTTRNQHVLTDASR